MEEQIYARHVKEAKLNQEQALVNVEHVVELDFKQYGKDLSWFNRYVEIAMVLAQQLKARAVHVVVKVWLILMSPKQ